jgi:hypothetical protein
MTLHADVTEVASREISHEKKRKKEKKSFSLYKMGVYIPHPTLIDTRDELLRKGGVLGMEDDPSTKSHWSRTACGR